MTDAEARTLIGNAIDDTLVVEAAAGTGKTTELVNRILQVLAAGRADVREIVAVTFTEKAAGELKLRLRQGLELARRTTEDAVVAERLGDAVRNLEEAHVSTIHGFCADLLRERPVEARIDPLFRVLTEGQAERLFDEAFRAWFHQHLEEPPEGMRRSLRRASRGFRPGEVDEDGPMERLRRAGFDLTQWRDFRCEWTRPVFDRHAAAAEIVGLVHALAEISEAPSYRGDNLFVDTEPVRRLSRDLKTDAAVSRNGPSTTPPPPSTIHHPPSDLDGLESQLIELARNRDFKRGRKGSGAGYSKGVTRARVLEARDMLTWRLQQFQANADADLAALLHTELMTCVDGYEALKAREGAVDFLDLLMRARDLVREDVGVRSHFQARFKRIFVDEFQDTDPLQAELLLLLAASDPIESHWRQVTPVPGKLFIVGDPKQSIYRFRRADLALYRDVCQLLIDRGAIAVELRKSFRGTPNIQRAINAAFAPVMDGDPVRLQARYMPLEAAREDAPGQPSVVALPVPDPYAQRFIAARAIEKSVPDAVGAYVDWLVNHSGWTVTERRDPGRRVRVEARHICILFRRFVSYGNDVTRPYVDALEARGVRHLLVGGRAFHDREEIETVRAALMAIEWPDDQLSVFATLRGGLFAIGDEDLLEYHHLYKSFHPFRVPETVPAGLEAIVDALTLLASLHRERNRVPVADTISTLLNRTRAHVGFVLRPAGEQVLANVLHVAELARQYELDGGMSFRGFVDALQTAASAGQAAEAPILEEGSDGVRLMTVHKAKGLEFPVVILGDITARLTPFDASRHLDVERELCALRLGGWLPQDLLDHRDAELLREQAEGERVAYVAATRARDLLVVPAVGDEAYAEGWVAPLNAAIYPEQGDRRIHTDAAGCPAFTSRDSVRNRPDGDPATGRTVCPGLHALSVAGVGHSVVWWSPEREALSLGIEASFGLRRDDLIVKDVPSSVLRGYRDDYDRWRSGRDAAIESASRPSVDVRTVTEYVDVGRGSDAGRGSDVGRGSRSSPAGPAYPVEVITIDGGDRSQAGRRYGTLVHAVLATVPLDAGDEVIARIAATQARIAAASKQELVSAIAAVSAVWRHPLLDAARRAQAQGRCLRETPVTAVHEGTLVEGVIDLAFDTLDGMTVVDFKTDRAQGDVLEKYVWQVALYADAIGRAAGKSTTALLVKV
jgi:ATP-dependent exoDNAse (exonuclease V) beta subunit